MVQLSDTVDVLEDGALIDRVPITSGIPIGEGRIVRFMLKCQHCGGQVNVEVPYSMLPESIDVVCFVNRHHVKTVTTIS